MSPSKKVRAPLLPLTAPAATVADQFCGGCVPQVTVPVKVSAAGRPPAGAPAMVLTTVSGELVLEICRLTWLLFDEVAGSIVSALTVAWAMFG